MNTCCHITESGVRLTAVAILLAPHARDLQSIGAHRTIRIEVYVGSCYACPRTFAHTSWLQIVAHKLTAFHSALNCERASFRFFTTALEFSDKSVSRASSRFFTTRGVLIPATQHTDRPNLPPLGCSHLSWILKSSERTHLVEHRD